MSDVLKEYHTPQRLRIALWAPLGAGGQYGGWGTAASRLYSQALPNGVEVSLIHGNPAQIRQSWAKEQHLIGRHCPVGILTQLRFLMASRKWIQLHARDFDVVHALSAFHFSVAPATQFEEAGVPAFIKVTGLPGGLHPSRGIRALFPSYKLRQAALRRLSGVFAISSEIESHLLSFGVPPSRVLRVPNGVNTERFSPPNDIERVALRASHGIANRATLLFVGAVGSRKRPDLVISALEVLLQQGVDCQLILLGPDREPEWTSRLTPRIQDLTTAGRVLWTKHSDDPETFYKMADIFVLPSASEGLANSVLEAMSSGLPCIVSSSSGMRDMVKGPECNGYVLDSPTAESIAEAVKAVLTDPNLFQSLSVGARRHAIRNFDSRKILELHLAAFVEASASSCQHVPTM